MSTARNIKVAENLGEAGVFVESADYGSMFGSNFQFDWFESLMKNSGTYLFSGGLVALIIKFGATIYQYIRNPNKETLRPNEKPHNLNRSVYVKTSFAWEVIKTALVGTALVGAIAAAAAFALATPVLFFVAMGGDALVNLGLLFWNIGKMALAHFQLRNKKDDPLSRAKLAKIDKEAIGNIKGHGLGFLIGLAVTAAVGVIFLFPQIGLSAIGAAALTFGAIKVTVAMIVGVTAGTALVVPLIPSVIKFTKWAVSGLVNAVKNAVTKGKAPVNQNKEEVKEVKQDKKEKLKQQQQQMQPLLKKSTQAEEDKKALVQHLAVRNNVLKAIDHKLESTVSPGPCREILIDHISDKVVAKETLIAMLDRKIVQLKNDISEDMDSDLVSLRQKEREHKLMAMLLLMIRIGETPKNQKAYEQYLSNYTRFFKTMDIQQIGQDVLNRNLDLEGLISFIEKTLPKLDVSLFSRQSDTRNMLETARRYAGKFPEQRVEAANTM